MQFEGIDLDALSHETELGQIILPEPIPGRIVHIDGDFLAYECSYEKNDDPKDWEDMKHNAKERVEFIKALAGASGVHIHLTPATSDKGKRFDLAILKEYQGNRKDKPKPRFLNLMREHLATAWPGTLHQDCEADDGMSSSQYAAIKLGNENLSIIASKDKDLNQVPGLHLNWDTGEIVRSNDFGRVYLTATPSGTKKLAGFGWKFFWAQMLAGDTADNISGLPLIDPGVAERATGKTNKKPVKVGPVMTAAIMDMCKTNQSCYNVVKALYAWYGNNIGFRHWKTSEPVSWQKAFVSEMQLLWMRRDRSDEYDVIKWLKENIK